MAGRFEPPPTWADVIIPDEHGQLTLFNPVWLQWFVKLVENLGIDGLPVGAASAELLASTIFAPRPETHTAHDALELNAQRILEARAFHEVALEAQAFLITNDQSILLNQIFGA